MYEIFVDGERVKEMENTKAERFNNIKVYSGDNWYPAQEGKIKNLYIETRHG